MIVINEWNRKAYDAANVKGFKCFLSFDIEAAWYRSNVDAIIKQVKDFGNLPGQYRYNNKV